MLNLDMRVGMRVVFLLTGQTGEVFKWDAGGVFVFVQSKPQAQGDKGYWPWKHVTVRRPRLVRRFPRKLRFPRYTPIIYCLCNNKTGRGKFKIDLVRERVICKKCKKAIGQESYPQRIRVVEKLYEEKYREENQKGNNRKKATIRDNKPTAKKAISRRKTTVRRKSRIKIRKRVRRPTKRKTSNSDRKGNKKARSHSPRVQQVSRKVSPRNAK